MMKNEQHKQIRNALVVAAVDCGHTIDSDRITLQCDPAKPGNALAQLSGRLLDAYLAAAGASAAPVAPFQVRVQPWIDVPDGWTLVPKEPTIEMIAALGWGGDENLAVGHALISKGIADDYARMLAAAPSQPAIQAQEATSVDRIEMMRAHASVIVTNICNHSSNGHTMTGWLDDACTSAEILQKELKAAEPVAQQAIAAARAAGQSIAATPSGLVFMNDGAEPGSSELDCPACGGSGHAGDVAARSAP